MSDDKPLTTGQAAAYCHVSQATVVNWIKDGRLEAYTTPGGHNRISQSDLVEFLQAHDMPVDPALEASGQRRLLLVSDSHGIQQRARALAEDNELELSIVASDYEASAQVIRLDPDVVVIDGATALDPARLCRWVRGHLRDVILVHGDNGKEATPADVRTVPSEDLGTLEAQLTKILESARKDRRSAPNKTQGQQDAGSSSRTRPEAGETSDEDASERAQRGGDER